MFLVYGHDMGDDAGADVPCARYAAEADHGRAITGRAITGRAIAGPSPPVIPGCPVVAVRRRFITFCRPAVAVYRTPIAACRPARPPFARGSYGRIVAICDEIATVAGTATIAKIGCVSVSSQWFCPTSRRWGAPMTTPPSQPAAKRPLTSQPSTDRASTSQASTNQASIDLVSIDLASTNQSPPTGPTVPDDRIAATPSAVPSAALLAANERLLAQRAAQKGAGPIPEGWSRPSATQIPMAAEVWTRLPPHLGWQSAAVTAVQRRTGMRDHNLIANTGSTPIAAFSRPTAADSSPVAAAALGAAGYLPPAFSPPPPATTICLHPSLAMALLRTGQVACGRLWLLLRALDTAGCGCLPLTAVQSALTGRESARRLCGPRRLRQLLQQGTGLFWQRDKTHLWLAGAGKVAARLGVARLAGHPIELPLAVLTQPIGLVRAHLYASFHSSRGGIGIGDGGNPISRAALTAVSGVSRRSQHAYERRTRMRVVRNVALGLSLNPLAQEALTWQHGQAVFILMDKRGKQGRPGRRYLAWQLPNSYYGPHARLGRGRNRRLNRQLVDLRTNGDAGNGRAGSEVWGRRYARSGAAAGQWLRKGPRERPRGRPWEWLEAEVYWQSPGGQASAIWYMLSWRESRS